MIAIPDPPIFSARNGLRLLCPELNRSILTALEGNPLSASALCARLMLESDTRLRERLDQLEQFDLVERLVAAPARLGAFRLRPAGAELLRAAALVGAWLTERPAGRLRPESDAAWRAFRALADAWELSLLQRLLLRPGTRSELVAAVPGLGREKAKRMLRRLRGAGLVAVRVGDDRVPRHVLTVWARRAIAVLAAIADWERKHLGDTAAPVAASDGAVALLASLPLIRPPGGASGVCAFTVEGEPDAPGPRTGAVWANLTEGRVAACRSGTSPVPPAAWVTGGVGAWLGAVIEARRGALQMGGDRALAEGALRALHEELFGRRGLSA